MQVVITHRQTVREGRWSRSVDFCYWDRPLVELAGLKMGLIGFGRIGQAVAKLADCFGMEVLMYAPRLPAQLPAYVHAVGLEQLFQESDVVSLHCPLARPKG